jgi:hypothetical protein
VRSSCSTRSPLVALAEVAPWPPWRGVSAERTKGTTGRTPVRRLARCVTMCDPAGSRVMVL